MLVVVALVGGMQMTVMDVVDVVAVRDALVAAVWSVLVVMSWDAMTVDSCRASLASMEVSSLLSTS